MCLQEEQQEHKPRSNNTKLKSKNHKPRNTNTNTTIDLPCHPNTKATNINPVTSKQPTLLATTKYHHQSQAKPIGIAKA